MKERGGRGVGGEEGRSMVVVMVEGSGNWFPQYLGREGGGRGGREGGREGGSVLGALYGQQGEREGERTTPRRKANSRFMDQYHHHSKRGWACYHIHTHTHKEEGYVPVEKIS